MSTASIDDDEATTDDDRETAREGREVIRVAWGSCLRVHPS